jgi:RimJ/RimL family protein N-acetyltransferase
VYDHNPASGRVLEKAGFRQEGFARKYAKKGDHYVDAYLFGLVKD